MAPSPALEVEPSLTATSPLVGKVPGCLQPKIGPVPEAVLLLQSACSPSTVLGAKFKENIYSILNTDQEMDFC